MEKQNRFIAFVVQKPSIQLDVILCFNADFLQTRCPRKGKCLSRREKYETLLVEKYEASEDRIEKSSYSDAFQ